MLLWSGHHRVKPTRASPVPGVATELDSNMPTSLAGVVGVEVKLDMNCRLRCRGLCVLEERVVDAAMSCG